MKDSVADSRHSPSPCERRDFREAFNAIPVRDHVDVTSMKAQYKEAMAGDEFITYASLFVFEELRKIMGDVTMLEARCWNRNGSMISAP